ncbi:MAG: AAA family ATPase [Eggerthellaceae bacterium]|nr:AAA family ATPase [Eggerthellaceae bacterium]
MKRLSKIRLNGRCFQEEVTLDLYVNPKHRFLRVFGRNGAGKSTLSEALADLAAGRDCEVSIALLDENGNPIEDQERLLNGIRVFNEKYVSEMIQIKEDGLGSIVMFEQQQGLEKLIEDEENTLGWLNTVINRLETEVDKYEDKSDPQSPNYHYEKMREVLKTGGCWAERDKRIKGGSRNSQATDNVLNQVLSVDIDIEPDDDLTEIIEKRLGEFEADLEKYLSLKDGQSEDVPAVPDLPIELDSFSDEDMRKLLSKAIDEPELTDRERAILEVMAKYGEERIAEIRETMSDEKVTYCPHCFRELGKDLKSDIEASIKTALSEEAEDYRASLADAEIEPIADVDWSRYEVFDAVVARRCESAVGECNALIGEYNNLIANRKNNVYASPQNEFPELKPKIDLLRKCLDELEKEAGRYLAERSDIAKKKEALDEANRRIARLEIEGDRKTWDKQKRKREKTQAQLEIKRAEKTSHTKELERLKQAKKSIVLALDIMNSWLAYIFMSTSRLTLEPYGDVYRLKSNGRDVRPADVSLGERNALGLCYFFAAMMEGGGSPALREPLFVVVDDPISSFDFENKVGIHSFLKMQFKRVLSGNPDSKVLVLTHDAMAMKALGSTQNELCTYLKNQSSSFEIKCSDPQELNHAGLQQWKEKAGSYTSGLRWIYDYCTGDNEYRMGIRQYAGNMTRKTLEAFSTFEYGVGISGITQNDDALSHIDEKTREYYENLMFRLVLHGESHMEDHVTSEGLIDFMSQFSDDAIDKTVMGVICLMYELQPTHVLSHLDAADSQERLDSWVAEIHSIMKS